MARRRNETFGVVATAESALGTSLLIRRRKLTTPSGILSLIDNALEGERPDGEQFQEKLQAAACARQLSCGFYHRWRYPKGEPEELICAGSSAGRLGTGRYGRNSSAPSEHLDTPGLLAKAAIRAYQDPPYDGDKQSGAPAPGRSGSRFTVPCSRSRRQSGSLTSS
jgi:hypothetical protein